MIIIPVFIANNNRHNFTPHNYLFETHLPAPRDGGLRVAGLRGPMPPRVGVADHHFPAEHDTWGEGRVRLVLADASEPMQPRHRRAVVVRVLEESRAGFRDNTALAGVGKYGAAIVRDRVLVGVHNLDMHMS